jgi:hypothetical protein
MIPGKTGLVYSPGDVGELVRAIKSLVSNETLAQKLNADARRHFIDFENSISNQTSVTEYLKQAKKTSSQGPGKIALSWISKFMVAERDGLVAEREQIFSSTSWRVSRPIRYIKDLISEFGANGKKPDGE